MLAHRTILLALFTCAPALATPEATLLARYDTEISKFADGAETGRFKAADGTSLGYRIFRTTGTPKGGIVLLPGYTESYEKYAELGIDLTQAGFDLFALDHRGMGRSARLSTNPKIVHVGHFEDYVSDALHFLREIVAPRQRGDLFLLAHSTGALIGSNVLATSNFFKAAAFSAALFEINLPIVPDWLAYLVVSFNILRGVGEESVPGHQEFDPIGFDPSDSNTTTSRSRASIQKQQWLKYPDIVQTGPSNQWLREAIRATWQREELAQRIATPILMFIAEDDRYVKRNGQYVFCQRAKHCKTFEVGRNSRHELLLERDEIRDEVLTQVIRHFDSARD